MVDLGFTYRSSKGGLVFISWQGRVVVTLRGRKAQVFLDRVNDASPEAQQMAMAKATGNFKRGNEKSS